jgi:protein-S-isoprenylcysteine O-methyltransferase Ste14
MEYDAREEIMASEAQNDTPGLIMPPPLFLLIAVMLALLLEWLLGFALLPAPSIASWWSWIGFLILGVGVLFAVHGAREFNRVGTNVNPFQPALKLVTTGPYSYTRNPMYLGMVLFMLGLSVMLSLEWGILLTPILWLAYDQLVVAREEAYLSAKFGEPYREFLSQTRRWL